MAVGGAAAAIPGIGSILQSAPAEAPEINGALTDAEAGAADTGAPMVAQVTDIRSGEITMFQGESQTVVKDPGMVARMYRATPQKGR